MVSTAQPNIDVMPEMVEQFSVHWAQSPAEIEEVQRLRFRIFSEELGVTLQGAEGIDSDQFDATSRHLYVRNTLTGEVIGTYRIITEDVARLTGWYTEQEFDITELKQSGLRLMEVGRACVHSDYRSGMVVLMLWKAILHLAKANQVDIIMGCTSVPNAARSPRVTDVQAAIRELGCFSDEFTIKPLNPFTPEMQVTVDADVKVGIPALFKGYLRLGGKFCGAPTYDADFQCADFFTFLPMKGLSRKYARHFGLE